MHAPRVIVIIIHLGIWLKKKTVGFESPFRYLYRSPCERTCYIIHTAIETVLQAGLNYLFRHKMNSLPGQPIKTAWASSFNA